MKIEPSNFRVKAGEKKFIDLKYKYSLPLNQLMISLDHLMLVSLEALLKSLWKDKVF